MRTPSAAEVLRIWELGSGKRAWYRALLLLAPMFPKATFGALADLTLGSRNAYLLTLRERLFGSTLSSIVTCDACGEKTEITISTHDLLAQAPAAARFAGDDALHVATPDGDIACRLLSSRDLQAVATAPTSSDAQSVLVDRAVLDDAPPLGPESRECIADAIVTADPLADIRLGVTCASCSRSWATSFDIAQYLWTEIEAEVSRLLDHVHRIAGAYGWSEATVLAMSRARRREYLRRAP